ncbi:MAG: sugar nucleotide-binding protein [Patescibacteria group bacterium]|jgi:dTDP-4-dehydrorhamnose reductase
MKILIFGKGYLGQRAKNAWGDEAVLSDQRISSREDALAEIARYQPDAVLNAVGVTGKPNVDWCDVTDNRLATIHGNTLLPIVMAEACQEAGVYFLHMGSGCIYYGDSPHPDKAWREHDHGNPEPVYSRTKLAADLVLSTLPNVGIARVRMPIDHIPGSRNLIDKLARYPKIIDVENSVTVIDDMLEVFHQLLEQKAPGIFHVTNPGTMKHRDLMALYVELVDPSHTNEWITAEDLVAQGLATKLRSNNFLASERLAQFGISMRPIAIALRDTMEKYAVRIKAQQL